MNGYSCKSYFIQEALKFGAPISFTKCSLKNFISLASLTNCCVRYKPLYSSFLLETLESLLTALFVFFICSEPGDVIALIKAVFNLFINKLASCKLFGATLCIKVKLFSSPLLSLESISLKTREKSCSFISSSALDSP